MTNATDVNIDNLFGRGAEAAKEAADSKSGNSYRRTVYRPKIGPGKHIIIRYLLDYNELYYAEMHQGVRTKDKLKSWPKDRKWPSSMSAVCRYDKKLAEAGIYHDCYICDNKVETTFSGGGFAKPRVRVFSLAVLREEIIGTQSMVSKGMIEPHKVGKIVGYRDKKRTVSVPQVDDNGKEIVGRDGKKVFDEVEEPEIVVINESMNTWFSFAAAAYKAYGSLCDRDFAVQQDDEGQDVKYPHMALAETPGLEPGTKLWEERYMEPLRAMGDDFNIGRVLLRQSNDDFYARFFDPNAVPSDEPQSAAGGASSQQQQAAPSNDVAKDRLAQMKQRIQGITADEPEKPSQPQAEEAPAAKVEEETAAEPAQDEAEFDPI